MPPFTRRQVLAASTLALTLTPALSTQAQTPAASATPAWPPVPALVAHRGASALKPELTMAAFEQALADGADLIELDVVMSKDGVPVLRHENALAALNADGSVQVATTNVATHTQWADRKTTKTVDGTIQTGWFAEDFTWAELQTLRAMERIPSLRPVSAALNGTLPLATLQDAADLVRQHTTQTGRQVGLFIELKHAAHAKAAGLDMARTVAAFLEKNQWSSAQAPVLVKSFEVQVLKDLRALSPVRIVQLLTERGGPPDLAAQGTSYEQMGSAEGLAAIAQYAQGISVTKRMAMTMERGQWTAATPLVQRAKKAGMQVHVWTLRPENQYLPNPYKKGTDPAARGDALAEARAILGGGVHSLITDDPGSIRAAFGR
jgi:glycerophosphoryl diester phosphodiesterase